MRGFVELPACITERPWWWWINPWISLARREKSYSDALDIIGDLSTDLLRTKEELLRQEERVRNLMTYFTVNLGLMEEEDAP